MRRAESGNQTDLSFIMGLQHEGNKLNVQCPLPVSGMPSSSLIRDGAGVTTALLHS